MNLKPSETAALRKLCLRAIEQAKDSPPGKSYVIPLVIPFPGEPFERAVLLEVQAKPEDYAGEEKR